MVLFQFTPGYFGNVFENLRQVGVLDVLIPFVLIFTIVYAVIQKTQILGAQAKKFNIVFALAVALLAIFPHVTAPGSTADVIPVINNSLPQIGLVIIAILMVMLIAGLAGTKKNQTLWEDWGKYLTYVAVAAVVYIFGASAGWWEFVGISNYFSDPNLLALIVVILVFAIVIAYVTSGDEEGKGKKGTATEEAARGAAAGATERP